jgi:hypothetical protein
LKRFKRGLGYSLFGLSWLLWGLMFVVPFVVDASAVTLATISTSLLITAEILFPISILLLGRPFYDVFKARLKPVWLKITGRNKE